MAAYSSGMSVAPSGRRSFSFQTASERQVPMPVFRGMTQSFSFSCFTPAPTLMTTPMQSLPPMNGTLRGSASLCAR